MPGLTLRCLGAASTVTGSKHLLESDALRIRLDRELGWQATVPRPNQVFEL